MYIDIGFQLKNIEIFTAALSRSYICSKFVDYQSSTLSAPPLCPCFFVSSKSDETRHAAKVAGGGNRPLGCNSAVQKRTGD